MPNRLAQSQSLYLKKHADNPIDWWPWCEEALETAKVENKPIFLSIGYSSCHWCTVMEGKAFSDQKIADYMNTNFLPIKVDREERPEIDSIYMMALQMLTGQGGWPLNIFLTPDTLIPFYGGTYFPISPRYGRVGFLQILQSLKNFYDHEKAKLNSVTSEVLENLQSFATLSETPLPQDLLYTGLTSATRILATPAYGPAFPMIPYAETTLRASRFPDGIFDPNPRNAALQRGLDLVYGGIFDAVAGGFHRYTVDPLWTVPHFEKMLYDNGQIVEYLANLWAGGVKEPALKQAVSQTVQWLKREMTSPTGYFYAAQDADSFPNSEAKEPEEGDFYVWSYRQLQQHLTTEELEAITEVFTITKDGNFEGKNVLQRKPDTEINQTVTIALDKLFTARYGNPPAETPIFQGPRNNQEAKTTPWKGRIPPVTDTKMIVAWNSLMISGLARAAAVFQQPEYLEIAIKCAQFILENQWLNRQLYRINYDGNASIFAQSEDYAFLIKAFLDLHQTSLTMDTATGNENHEFWLENALKFQAEFDQLFWSQEGGYFNTSHTESQQLLIRERSYNDNATPSANGIAIANLVRLSLLTENLEFLDKAEQALKTFIQNMKAAPQGSPSLFTALDWYQNQTLIRTNMEQLAQLNQQYHPVAIYQAEMNLPAGCVGLVCQGLTCLEPATSEQQFHQQIQQSQQRQS